ncbi:ATR-interacting protein isoform X2 [Nannospalax galili]|uniref:ATR-interacting protein isoform X2 n=1 Tax=Nannospalax galili TaxID=1026970 RepID=UPI0004ED634C|nr:ATR-interacting protein isoform X2 [Nannospalax galili]
MAATPGANSSRRLSEPPAPLPGLSHGFGNPPIKRARGFPEAADPEDPFDEHAEFTEDDLEELDILASQALSQCPAATPNLSSVHKIRRLDGLPKSPAGKNRENVPVKDNFELEVLQTQYKELKKKLKAMEEEVLIKNGEIKILRDSLHQTESILEEQRRSHFLLEQEKTQALSEKEKEFSKKLQSLQSELQFKDAEMNELRTRLQSSEQANRLAAPTRSHMSPRKSFSVVIKPEACSPYFGKSTFPTKESFSANMPLSYPCQSEAGCKSLVGREISDETHNLRSNIIKPAVQQKTLTESWMQRSNTQGSILINLLLKQPLIPGLSLGLCHLLSSCSEVPTGTLSQPPGLGSNLIGISSLKATGSRDGLFSPSTLREAQNLALTGLNLVARNEEGSHDGDPEAESRRVFPLCHLPGAVHILPLVHFFIGLHCQALQDLAAAKRSGTPGGSPTRTSCVSSGAEANSEDSLCNLESFSVASLSILQHLVCHSGAVVFLLLSDMGTESADREGNGYLGQTHTDVISAPREAEDDQRQHPLLKMLLQLLAFSSAASGHFQANVLSQCLKVLVKLAENASCDFLPRFSCVLPMLPQCLNPELPLPCVLLAVELLSLLVDHDSLAQQLCSHSGCLLLRLYIYIISRPDKVASETQWLQLEQEVIWLLAKLSVHSPSPPVTGSDCQCNVEVVRALTMMLHRQWMTMRRAGGPPRTHQQKRTVRCLRDTVLLLHSLSQKDKLFTMHCVEVLHQYDQVMPGVSMLIRALPDVTDCEEAALDDLCATETDTEDPEMDCS